jgi:pimeloyl-ACP methyl ester carboxylesterase
VVEPEIDHHLFELALAVDRAQDLLLRELGEHAPVADRLGEIRCPTLVMVGAEDVPFLKAASEMTAGIRGARQVVIPDAAHQPQLENPDAWLDAIRDHLTLVRT